MLHPVTPWEFILQKNAASLWVEESLKLSFYQARYTWHPTHLTSQYLMVLLITCTCFSHCLVNMFSKFTFQHAFSCVNKVGIVFRAFSHCVIFSLWHIQTHHATLTSLLKHPPDVRDLSPLEAKVDWWMISSAVLSQKEQTNPNNSRTDPGLIHAKPSA